MVSAAYVPGDTRRIDTYYVTAQTVYDNEQVGTYQSLKNQNAVIDIALSWAHPVVGVFCTAINYMIPTIEYARYTNILERILHDCIVRERRIDVYTLDTMTNTYKWEPRVYATMKETYAQCNTVYYYNGTRKTPTNIDLGLCRTDTGQYYGDIPRLESIARSSTYTQNYPYSSGTKKIYNKDYLFKY